MAGALIHLAMGNPEKMGNPEHLTSKNCAYVIGILLPDIAKSDFIKTKEDFDRLFLNCDKEDICTYEEYMEYCKEPHFTGNKRWTNNPNLTKFFECSFEDIKKPIWQGVLCHITGDKNFYYGDYCVNDSQIREDFKKEGLEDEQWRDSQTAQTLYGEDGDYNLLNQSIEDEFDVLRFLPPELREKFGIGFSKSGKKPKYMNLENIRKCIYKTRELCEFGENGDTANFLEFYNESLEKEFVDLAR